ncbi:hypothetical protein GCM10009846_22000 [Agrococcus versicolor]|uniref:RelA/SpoT domain-containing protein n=1 Tax=Agrococcus versicolor TaxID=501482 RepID=A0ABP5MNZ1_9MICO
MTPAEQPVADPTEAVRRAYATRGDAWVAAMAMIEDWLDARADDLLADADRMRLYVLPGRIKDEARTIDRLTRAATELDIAEVTVEQVEELVRDVVGVKVLCKSTRDQALLAADVATALSPGIHLIEMRDYVADPKPSGYRAVHALVDVDVPMIDGPTVVAVEVQIKTRVQDAWGELTHEDLYKPGGGLRPSDFHRSVGRTMANLLAEVDRLADDLAGEFDVATTEPAGERARSESGRIPIRTVVVRSTGPRYALAVDDEGRQGLIPAFAVRALAPTAGHVDVDAFVPEGATLTARVFEDERGLYYLPVALPEQPAQPPLPEVRTE